MCKIVKKTYTNIADRNWVHIFCIFVRGNLHINVMRTFGRAPRVASHTLLELAENIADYGIYFAIRA